MCVYISVVRHHIQGARPFEDHNRQGPKIWRLIAQRSCCSAQLIQKRLNCHLVQPYLDKVS